jgi:hypothetical protein
MENEMDQYELTNEDRFGIFDDTEFTPARLDRFRAQGMPEEAIRPNRTIDLEVAKRHGWVFVDGFLMSPPE